jgi:hypothetical protein
MMSMSGKIQRCDIGLAELARWNTSFEQSVELQSSLKMGGERLKMISSMSIYPGNIKRDHSLRPLVSGTQMYDQTIPKNVRPAKMKAVLAPRFPLSGWTVEQQRNIFVS